MPAANTLVFLDGKYIPLSVRASLHVGRGDLHIAGPIGLEIKNVIIASINAISDLAAFDDRFDLDRFADHNLFIHTSPKVPVLGESYGLALSMAILAAATNRQIPQEMAFTGCIGPAGEVLSVEDIYRKRAAAKALNFERIMLPGSQLDMMNTEIIQCPVRSIPEAYAVTFHGD